MAKKTDDRTLNISVIGLSGTEREKGAAGIGKSCLCNRFICQVADKYSQDHISVLSQSDFAGRVINNDHFLYWGEVTKTDDGNNFTFHVIEQTEFIDDVSFQPFKTGRTDPYLKRSAMTKVQSAEKLMYICKDQLGMETDSSYEQKIIPDGKLNVDGFICCFDVSPVQQRTLESQVDFVVHLLNSAIKSKKPVVLVTTKNDEASDRYLKEAEKIVARKEYKNNIPLIGTSAHENVNVELAFMTLAHLIDKTKTRPKIIPFSEAVKQRKEILDVATEAYRSLLRVQVTDSKATWASSRRKLEKESDCGHYIDLFGTDSAKRLFKRHITNLREEQIKKREVSFIRKLPDALHHFLPDLITINDRPWSGCQRLISNHPDFDDYFVEVPGVDSWKFQQEFVDNYAETRIPFDLLNSSDAENCFRNHLNALQAEFRKSQLKEKFKRALEDNPHVIPGKDLKETAIFFIGKECYNDLTEEERQQVYEHHQHELKQQAKLEFQELLCEKLDLFVRMIGTTERITPEDIRFITKELEEDYRYKKLDKIEEERKIILLNHLGFMECPSKERCHFREKCAENKVQLLLASRPVRPEPQKNIQPTECSPLNLVLLGKDGLATSLMKEIRLVCNDDEFHCYGKLYSLDYRTIENDVSVEFNTLAIFKPDVCICVYNSRESLDYLKASLATTNEDEFSLSDLPMVIVQAYNKDLSEKEQVILHSRGQKIARQCDCPFIDIPFEHDEQDPFCRQQITRALDSLGLELNNDGRPLSEILEPDLRVGMCLMCGDAYPAEIPMGPLLNSNPTQVRADLNPSINIEANLESSPELTKQKIEICCGSYHNFVSKIQKEEEDDDVLHGFILVFSPKRKASFYTMKAFAETLRRYWATMPILILAITDNGASTIFFQDELSQSLIQKANEIADELGIEYMTTSAHFQNQALVYNNFFKETWHKRDEINESYYCEASSPPAYDESMAHRPPAPLPKTYDTYTKSSTSNSQSTEDSDPLYDQPLRYRHHSDSEPERPSSTSPPPFRADPSGEYAQNGEHLVRPSVIKRLNKNAGYHHEHYRKSYPAIETEGAKLQQEPHYQFRKSYSMKLAMKQEDEAWAINERRQPSKASTLPTDLGQNFHENGSWNDQSRHASTGSRESEETVWVENDQYQSFYEMQRKSNLYSKKRSSGINAPLAKPEQIEIADYATVKDALDLPLIENDYASVNDALPEGQLQRIKSTQRKAKDKKLKTDSEDSDISSLERERERRDLYAKVNRKPTPHKKKPKQRSVEGPIISMPFASDERGRHLGRLRDPDDHSNSMSEGSEGTGDETRAIISKQRKRRSLKTKKGRSPGGSESSRGAFSPQYSDDNFAGSPPGYYQENPYDIIPDDYSTISSMTSSMDGDIDLNSSGGWRRKKDIEKDTLKKQKKEERMRKKEEERKQKELQKKQKKLNKKTDGRPGTSESGCRLVDFQMSATNPSLPQYVETCVEFIREEGINAEGIYRIPGNKQQVEILQQKLQEDPNVDIRSLDIQVNTVATVLKAFFKDTEPLVPMNLQEELLEAAEIPEKSARLLAIRGVLKKIYPVNFEVLKYFITHLNELSQHKEKHSMDSRNLALCLWPTILRMEFVSYDKMAQSTKLPGEVIQTLIEQCGFFFHGEPEC